MKHYRIAGLSVESDLILPALPADPQPPAAPDIVIRQGQVPLELAGATHLGPTWQIAGAHFLLRIPKLTRCLLTARRRRRSSPS